MLTRVCLSIALLVALPACSQVVPAATGGTPAVDNETPMQTPPPVSGEPYPTLTGSETRSNYLRGGLSFETAYDDNEVPYGTTHPIGDVMYSVRPTITIDLTTPRFHQTLTYNPGFTFYQRTSGYNESDQFQCVRSAEPVFRIDHLRFATVSNRRSDRSVCRSAQQCGERRNKLSAQRESYARSWRNILHAYLPQPERSAWPLQFKFARGISFLQSPRVCLAVHRGNIPVFAISVLSGE